MTCIRFRFSVAIQQVITQEKATTVLVTYDYIRSPCVSKKMQCILASRTPSVPRLVSPASRRLAFVWARIQNGLQSKAACVAREVAQHKADSVMTHVLNVQDRLVQALQAELTMTNRTREAAQVRNNSISGSFRVPKHVLGQGLINSRGLRHRRRSCEWGGCEVYVRSWSRRNSLILIV